MVHVKLHMRDQDTSWVFMNNSVSGLCTKLEKKKKKSSLCESIEENYVTIFLVVQT